MKGGKRPPLTRWGKIEKWLWHKRIGIVMAFAGLMRVPVDVYSVRR